MFAILKLLLLSISSQLNADQGFDVRRHLCTVTRYDVAKDMANTSAVAANNIPNGCSPIHVNLVARHGTRSPNKKRMRELDKLASHLGELIREAEEQNLSLEKVPLWLRGWKSPWRGKLKGGELIRKGEEELYNLGIRIRERFSELFDEEYHPDVYPIKATQVPRASASAVAFGMGLLSEKGGLGPAQHRAFAVTSEIPASDIILRFHDCCGNYKDFKKRQEPAVDKLKEPVLDEITSALVSRYGLKFTRQDTATLWSLCKQEASVLDITDRACGLFSPSEVALLEWADDLELFILKGYGNSINYRMGVPLLEDVVQSMEQAIKANEEKHPPGSYEKARLRFAHAETVVPFTCLLGLFLEGSEFQKIQREEPLELPPKPPQSRNWRGSIVAPFAGNNMLVLHSCPANSASKYFVQVLHNEQPIPMTGCNGSDFCPFEEFKEKIVAPHLKHDYDSVCTAKLEEPEQKPASTQSVISPFLLGEPPGIPSQDICEIETSPTCLHLSLNGQVLKSHFEPLHRLHRGYSLFDPLQLPASLPLYPAHIYNFKTNLFELELLQGRFMRRKTLSNSSESVACEHCYSNINIIHSYLYDMVNQCLFALLWF